MRRALPLPESLCPRQALNLGYLMFVHGPAVGKHSPNICRDLWLYSIVEGRSHGLRSAKPTLTRLCYKSPARRVIAGTWNLR